MFEDLFGSVEVRLDENFGMVVRAFASFFAVAVHVVPAEFSDNVLELAEFTLEAETHVEIGTAFVDVAIIAIIAFIASLLHKVRANLQIMTEIALVSVPAGTH